MIRPVEMQGMIQRTQDISTLKHNENTKPQVEQVQIAVKAEKDLRLKHEQVIKKHNAESKDQKHDAKEKGNGSYYGSNQEKRKNTHENGDKVIQKHQGFDVKI